MQADFMWRRSSYEHKQHVQVEIVDHEVLFNRHSCQYLLPRPLEEISADLEQVRRETMRLLAEV